ncbi:UDP-N-acetylmuramoyl-L-alanine--D-glutamate ligase [Elioraea sp.]|uniref:UDP-N-acetylmuramoyl-L-alanine--D-glutamate ligase n=1 Tax=Elioraea sp. TaxID=2185103 RepID=UPI003F72562F
MAGEAPFAGETVAVMGLGRAGLPGAQALVRLGARVLAWDDSEAARWQAEAAGVPLTDLTSADFRAIDALLLSPGIPHRLPAPHPIAARALAAGTLIACDADLLFRAVRETGSAARFAGITGTNGKSTTTALLGHILECAGQPHQTGGNLGTPALALNILGSEGVYALEMSSYMLERIARIRFDAAAMLNLSPDHLDRHGDMAGYTAAKRRIFDRQDGACTAVVGVDDDGGRAMADELAVGPAPVIRVSGAQAVSGGIYVENARLIDARGTYPQRIASLVRHPTLPGTHNAQNAAAAAALAFALGIPAEDVAAGIASFPGLPHRQERVAELDGVLFVNDSKGTNADAAARALACYPRVFWIAGGRAKEGGIAALAPLFPRIARAFLIGESAPAFAATLAGHGIAHEIAGTLEEAVPTAFAAARADAPAVVLLSPAAASFDQFANFEVRGATFRAAVARLMAERAP